MKDIAQKINSDKDFKSTAYKYLKQQLEEERSKPVSKRDFKKIDRLSHDICELLDGERISPDDCSENIERLYGRIAEYEKKRHRPSVKLFRRTLPVLCAVLALFTVNCISVLAWDMNIISAVIEFTKGGFSVNYGEEEREVIKLPTSEDDPYGIIAECAKYDIYPETPHYLPDGFNLSVMDNDVSDYSNFVELIFRNKENKSITFTFTRYWKNSENTGIPSDKYNITETSVNGKSAIISKEDNQYTITFKSEDTVFLMFAQDVSYDECEKIVSSIK